MSAENVAGGPTTVTVPTGSYYWTTAGSIPSLLTEFQTQLTSSRPPTSGGWTVTISTTTGLVTIACTEAFSITWTSTTLRNVLGFAADITSVTSATGTKQARGLWFPGCTLLLDSDPAQAPKVTDLRTSQSPTGVVLGLVGNTFYRHTGLHYPYSPYAQVWSSAATYENGSWEEFFAETQLGQGATWFTPSSQIQIWYPSAGSDVLLGVNANGGSSGLGGWYITGVNGIEPKLSTPGFTGLLRVDLGTLVSSG